MIGSLRSRVAVFAAAAVGLSWQVSSASPGCDLAPWLSGVAAPGEEGYHVLCATAPNSLEVYRRGVDVKSPEVVTFDKKELRQKLTQLLSIKATIEYPAGHNHGPLKWTKQPWALFAASGDELPLDEEADAIAELANRGGDQVLLLFEGGSWRWPTISVGYKRDIMPGIWLRTVARQPALFEVKIEDTAHEELSIKLLSNVVTLAEKKLVPSSMEGKVDTAVRSSEQTFLSYSSDPELKKLRAGTAKLLRATPQQLAPLQVLRYGKNQHYDAHRDYWDPREFPDVKRFTNADGYWSQRHATLLWYLSAPEKGGETWFPRAHGGPIPWNEWMACDARGAKISPANATAVLFYSLRADGEIDEFSWHCGCKVEAGTKWAANSWMELAAPHRGRKPKKEL